LLAIFVAGGVLFAVTAGFVASGGGGGGSGLAAGGASVATRFAVSGGGADSGLVSGGASVATRFAVSGGGGGSLAVLAPGRSASGGVRGSCFAVEDEPAGGELPTVRGGSPGLRSSESSVARRFLRVGCPSDGEAVLADESDAEGRSNAPARSATTSAPAATAPPISHFPRSSRLRRRPSVTSASAE
jgi:hypothetical protein